MAMETKQKKTATRRRLPIVKHDEKKEHVTREGVRSPEGCYVYERYGCQQDCDGCQA